MFRDVFADPLAARRAFRAFVAWHTDDEAVARLWFAPDEFGEGAPFSDPAAAADPAFIYWTQRARRPRALLIEAAAALWTELERRAQAARLQAAQDAAHDAGDEHHCLEQPRKAYRDEVPQVLHVARLIYNDPRTACRSLLRSIRRRGVEPTRLRLEKNPEAFGRLIRSAEFFLSVIPYPSTREARNHLDRLLRRFDMAAAARAARGKPGPVVRAQARYDEAAATARGTPYPHPTDGAHALDDAARIIAILYRRRAVDEQPNGNHSPPKVEKQLAAMLPDSATPVIEEAIRRSAKHSGEDPIWNRGHGHELGIGGLGIGGRLSTHAQERGRGGGFEL